MTHSIFKPAEAVSESLGNAEYNRQRFHPQPRDPYYIHLADVRLFLSKYEGQSYDTVLDYGCGGSPYRSLFKAARYLRADYVKSPDLDCMIGLDARLDVSDDACDMVLSTQVLEHVFSPQDYLKEAWRVLKPGGKLILTTHGIWEDHGCPYDFRRWTQDGLRRELEEAGFQIQRVVKLTTGPRAVLFLFSQFIGQVHDSRRRLSGLAFRLLRRSSFAKAELRHQWMDRQFADHRAVDGNGGGHGIYLALGIEGIKPEQE
ncbi:MAG: class I SAM-dependent methyltransferase [Verrucomicrobiota bacterium]